jgi:hypothetical protein
MDPDSPTADSSRHLGEGPEQGREAWVVDVRCEPAHLTNETVDLSVSFDAGHDARYRPRMRAESVAHGQSSVVSVTIREPSNHVVGSLSIG